MTPPARLLDVTRTLRRAGRWPTGVDRVELAYAKALLKAEPPVFALARTRLGYVLLDRTGLRAFVKAVEALPPPKDALRALRKLALARTWPPGLGRMLETHLPKGTNYFNVGHSNLTERVLGSVSRFLSGKTVVLVHDIIPLLAPELQREGTVGPFEEKMRRVGRYADLVIANSQDTKAQLDGVFAQWGYSPDIVVAHLGVELAEPAPLELSDRARVDGPYVVSLGTIEPRKNHAFLLDLWQEMGPDAPYLMIVGQRGWNNETVFDRLDALPSDGRVRELGSLSDGAIRSLLEGSHGLVFPSKIEGFGLPALEAAALGVPVLVNDLPVFKETLGNIAIYAPVSDRYLWIKEVNNLKNINRQKGSDPAFEPPTWSDHFKTVLSLG